MKRIWIAVVILVLLLMAAAFCWLVFGRTVVLRLNGRRLGAVADLSFFRPLKPDMRRSEVRALLGEPDRVHVTDVEYDENGEVEYQEIRWVFPRPEGILAYYVEEYDTPGGSVEYLPQSMALADLFRIPVSVGWGKRFIEIRSQGRRLVHVYLRDRRTIEKVNWYWEE